MPTNNDEIERIKRIQEQQIKVRYDPNEKRAKYDQISYQKRQGTKVTKQSLLKDIPDKVWGALIGAGVGLLFLILLARLPGMPSYGPLIGVGGILFFGFIGWLIGSIRDWGKGDWGNKGGRR